jgi:hypothetical protein
LSISIIGNCCSAGLILKSPYDEVSLDYWKVFFFSKELILRSLNDANPFFSQSDSKYHPDPPLVMYVRRTHRTTNPNGKIKSKKCGFRRGGITCKAVFFSVSK